MREKLFVKFIDFFKSFRVWIMIFFIFFSLVAISYTFDKEGVVINGIGVASFAQKAGMEYDSKANLRNLEKITHLNDKKVINLEDYFSYIENLNYNDTLIIKTNKNPTGYNIDLIRDDSVNQTINDALGISVRGAPDSNVKLGIELEGGSRLILKPKINITEDELTLLVSSLQNRLDIYGASGTKVNKLSDSFTGEKFIIVESTSSNKNDIFELISRQGDFKARVGEIEVFTGDNIAHVFTDPQHSGLESCSEDSSGHICTFRFSIEIDEVGANKFFEETKKLNVVGSHLSEKVYFDLDGKEITALSIASSFKYQKVTSPQITLTGEYGSTREKAIENGQKEMKLIQTILSTKKLPSELEVVQSYSVSNSTGAKFLDNAFLVAIVSIFLVASLVALRYRHFSIFIGIMIALIAEVIIVFGFAAFMRLSIDLAAIGGLIAAIGTGVDDQIIITDEYFREQNNNKKTKDKIKGAFVIIMIAYLLTLAAMGPLMFAGLKMLQGFAFMIIIGVTVGVFITRPAYAAILRVLMTSREERRIEDLDDD